MMSNSEYWESRIAKETWKTYNSAEEKNIDLLKMYSNTSEAIKKEMYILAERAEKNGGLSRSEQYRLQHLLEEQGKIFKEIEKLGEMIEKNAHDRMIESGKEVYANIQSTLGNTDFSYPDKKTMEQMLRNPWKGSFFSQRLWFDMGKLERTLNTLINDGISTGKTVTQMAVELSSAMNEAFNKTYRLVRSETMNYMNRSAIKGYEDAGIEEVQWWAAEDERTCRVCGGNHGRIYPIKKAPNLPAHPNCRCTWLPVLEKELPQLTETEESALIKYIGPDSYLLNDKLRNGYELSNEDKEWIIQLDNALDKMPTYEGEVIRDLYFMYKEDIDAFLETHRVGDYVNYKQYLSSTCMKVYNDNADIRIHILSKHGKDVRKFNEKEQEILFQRNSAFYVKDIKYDNERFIIYLEEQA